MHIPEDIRSAVTGFMIRLCKGLIDDERWNWDIEEFDWQHYQSGFTDPTILRTTISVFLNNLQVDDCGVVLNYEDAKFRAFQYFRMLIDQSSWFTVKPVFTSAELEEPDWRSW